MQNPHIESFMLKICIAISLFCSGLNAQVVDFQFYGKSIPEIRESFQTAGVGFHAAELLPDISAIQMPVCTPAQDEIPVFFSPGLARFQVEDLPFFCRIEHKIGKKLPLLVKFRLGSVEYVDWLEGKK